MRSAGNMNSKVCVNCVNKKPVNATDNRLVTESCGHVKCMQCLLQETSGCKACATTNGSSKNADNNNESCDNGSEQSLGDSPLSANDNSKALLEESSKSTPKSEVKKPKLNISHIKSETVDGIKTYTCTICNRKFSSRSQIIYHAYCSGEKKPYECPHPECQKKSFATLSHYNYHMLVHNGDRCFQCDVCEAKFVLKSKLQRHKLKHIENKNWQCSECGKAFNNGTALRVHMRQHTGEKPYKCEQCGRCFRDSSNYRKHLRKHKDNPCHCKVCGRSAVGTRALAQHVASKHEPRKHQCKLCGQTFYERKDMRRHAFVHTELRPWWCKQCSHRFRRKDNLDRHVRNTHGPGSAAAQHCSMSCEETPDILSDSKPEQTVPNLVHDDMKDRAKLLLLNPLPPLPKDIIKKHLYDEEEDQPKKELDKSYIMEANTARESVIVGNIDRKIPTPVTEYVHKIRKANSLSSQKEVRLPPIDEKKFIELTNKHTKKELDVGPLPKNIQTYKNILDDKPGNEDEKVPEVHWRKKHLTDSE